MLQPRRAFGVYAVAREPLTGTDVIAAQANSARSPNRWPLLLFVFLILGCGVSLIVAWILSATVTFVPGSQALQAMDGDDAFVTASAERGFGAARISLARELGMGWGPMRAAGPPDTLTMGDNTSAWASLSQDGQQEWLELDYPTVDSPRSLMVYETLAPGAVVRATVIDGGQEIDAWKGSDPGRINASGIYVATLPLSWNKPASRLRIYIDSPRVSGWNEIDAVGLVDANGHVQWAKSVRASSTYAVGRTRSANASLKQLASELPSWATVDVSDATKRPGVHLAEAYGWPMLAFYREAQPAVVVSTPKFLSAPTTPPMSLPRPIWPGLLVDSILYGALLLALYLATAGIRRALKGSSQLRRGRCIACGYDLRYDFAGGCPECGWNRLPERVRTGDLRAASGFAREI